MRAFENFVKVQSDAALRSVAALYSYDDNDGNKDEATLRGGADEVNQVLLDKLNERLEMAGLSVVEARINYLAYTPEIAAALDKLSDENVVELDNEQKARMVSNLLVVLCADESAQPVVNASGENK